MARRGAITAALAMLAGVLLVQAWPALPTRWLGVPIGLVAAALAWWCPCWRWACFVLLGTAWALWRGALAMDARLPRALEGRDITVVGSLVGLPLARTDASRFTLQVERASLDGRPLALRGRITVSWYEDAPPLRACTRWHLLLRLKRPRALLDPGAADSERTALERGIVATGYVRDDDRNHQLPGPRWCVDGARAAIADDIMARVRDRHDAALLRAFAVGDTRGLSQGPVGAEGGRGGAHSGAHEYRRSLFHRHLPGDAAAWLYEDVRGHAGSSEHFGGAGRGLCRGAPARWLRSPGLYRPDRCLFRFPLRPSALPFVALRA